MQTLIRVLTPEDVAGYRTLRVEASYDPSFNTEPSLELGRPAGSLRHLLSASRGFMLGAFADNALVGMVGFGDGLAPNAGTLYGLFVARSARRQHVATRLICHLVRMAILSGRHRISLRVAEDNVGAIALYCREGFTLSSTAAGELTFDLDARPDD